MLPITHTNSLLWLRWLAILAPITFLAITGYLLRGPVHEALHHFPGYLFVLGALVLAVSAFSFFVFSVIGRVERSVLEQNERLSALLAVGRAASSSLHVADVLDAALTAILAVTTAESAEVWLVSDDELVLARQDGAAGEAFGERTRLRVGEGLPGLAAERGTPVVSRELAEDRRFVREGVKELGFQTYYAQPFARPGRIVGVLAVASRSPAALSSVYEQRLLEGIGEQLAVAIENAQLHEQVLDAAVLDERERLARELHDGLAQVLGYVNTQTLAVRKLLASGRLEEAERELSSLEAAARRVFTDVREAILGLRTSSAGLLAGLRRYVEDFSQMTETPVQLELEPDVEQVRLPRETEIQLVRIAQEALANVRKHAGAARARVALAVDGATLRLEVADDGRGFDECRSIRTGWPRFGLQTMRERAQAVGGTFELSSAPGTGTTVVVHVPLSRVEEAADARLAG